MPDPNVIEGQAELVPLTQEDHPPPATTPNLPAEPNPMSMLAQAIEIGHDVDKLERLMDLADRWEQKESERAFNAAMAKFQSMAPAIAKSKTAHVLSKSGAQFSYQYADLDTIMRTIRPALAECGLSVAWDTEFSDDGLRVTSICTVLHSGGFSRKTRFVVPLDPEARMNVAQRAGSANSYANRYNVINALGLTSGEDDDGTDAGAGHDAPRKLGQPRADSASRLEETCPIGKYKGERWDAIPLDYLEWMVGNLGDKPDIHARAKRAVEDKMAAADQRQASITTAAAMVTGPSVAEAARGIATAGNVDDLDAIWATVPEDRRAPLRNTYAKRRVELQGKS